MYLLTGFDTSTGNEVAIGSTEVGNRNVCLTSFGSGLPAANAVLLQHITSQPLTLPVGLTGSFAYCGVAPTAAVTLTINYISSGGTVTANVGTVNFAIGAIVGTFTFTTALTTIAGDMIQVTAPSSQDATFANVSLAVVGTV